MIQCCFQSVLKKIFPADRQPTLLINIEMYSSCAYLGILVQLLYFIILLYTLQIIASYILQNIKVLAYSMKGMATICVLSDVHKQTGAFTFRHVGKVPFCITVFSHNFL